MRREKSLFTKADLWSALENQKAEAVKEVTKLAGVQIQASSDEQLIGALEDKFEIVGLTLYEDRIEKTMTECQIETRDRFRYGLRSGESIKVPGVQVTVRLPYSGDSELWNFRPSSFTLSGANADVTKPTADGIGWLTFQFTFDQHELTPEKIQQEIDSTVTFVKGTVENQRPQIVQFKQALRQALAEAIARRRSTLGGLSALAKALDIPVTAKPGMPSLTPIAVTKKVIRQLPPIPDSKQAAGFSITADAYTTILAAIRSQGRTFEKTPATFAKFGEEELRNIILGNLNTHFNGQASGETFRARGKTDICIEQDNRAAFIGELKIWAGVTSLIAALEQLLGYLTWRDCKAALVVFNKDRSNFSEILEKAPEALRGFAKLYISEVKQSEPGEWQMNFRAPTDEGRVVTVQLMIYNLLA